MKKYRSIILLGLCLVLTSCTVGKFTLENTIDTPPDLKTTKPAEPTPLKYHLTAMFNRSGLPTAASRKSDIKGREEYRTVTEEILTENHFNPIKVEDKEEADLQIKIVEYLPFPFGKTHESLTFYSLGLIPTWASYKNHCDYNFKNINTGQGHKYWLSSFRFHHLLMLPFSWTLFVVDDSVDKYEDALQNFLDNRKNTEIKITLSNTARKICRLRGHKVDRKKNGVAVAFDDGIETVTFTPPVIMSDGMTEVIRIDHKKQQYWVTFEGGIGGGKQKTGPFKIKKMPDIKLRFKEMGIKTYPKKP